MSRPRLCWQICSGPRRLQPRADVGERCNAHFVGERCRGIALLIRGETVHRKNFFANKGLGGLPSQLDIVLEQG
jgi:hypothetical protein